MASRHEQICRTIAAQLDAATFSCAIAVEAATLPDVDRENLPASPVTVRVVPSQATTAAAVSRDSVIRRYSVDVGILAPADRDAGTDWTLLELLEEIADAMQAVDQAEGKAAWLRTDMSPGLEAGFAVQELPTKREFVGAIRLSYEWQPE